MMSGLSPAQIEALLRTLQAVQATIQEHRKKPVTPAKGASGRR
jgi:hypothetical protein